MVLVHGYCSGSNPWKPHEGDFTNAVYFLDASANKNNAQFTELVAQFVTEHGMTSFGFVSNVTFKSKNFLFKIFILYYFFLKKYFYK